MNIYTINGFDPERTAYGLARFSRSPDDLLQSLRWIEEQKKSASNFLDTYYFQYGHSSIADLGHAVLNLDGITLLHAFILWQEQVIDGQERSTRYQDYSKADFFTSPGVQNRDSYKSVIDFSRERYLHWTKHVREYIVENYPRPDKMNEAAYNRTVDARSFDYARMFLSSAFYTGMGLVVSGRSLERILSRLRTQAAIFADNTLDTLADEIAKAVSEPSYGPDFERTGPPSLPTLTKYTQANEFQVRLAQWVQHIEQHVVADIKQVYREYESRPVVDRITFPDIDTEVAATLLWENGNRRLRTYRDVLARTPSLTKEIISKVNEYRGKHDALPRAFRAGLPYVFELAVDFGTVRDFNRHRRSVNFFQPVYNVTDIGRIGPIVDKDRPVRREFSRDLQELRRYAISYTNSFSPDQVHLKPFGMIQPMLLKCDHEEMAYITELRTGVKGHHNYREASYMMYLLGKGDSTVDLRVTHPNVDELLTR